MLERYLMGTIAAITLASLSAACGDGGNTTRYDQGTACLAQLEDDTDVRVVVISNCVSGSAEDLIHTCDVDREGNVVTIQSETSYSYPNDVTSDCQLHEAHCELPALEPGEYTIRIGDAEMALTLPASDELPQSPTDVLGDEEPANCIAN